MTQLIRSAALGLGEAACGTSPIALVWSLRLYSGVHRLTGVLAGRPLTTAATERPRSIY